MNSLQCQPQKGKKSLNPFSSFFFSYEGAEKRMLKALSQVQSVKQSMLSSKWESLLNNLGHVARKLGKLEEALGYHQQALVLKPMASSTYAAIGYVQTLMQKYFEAVESFHKALSLRRDDAFSTTMLNNVVEHLVDDITPFESKTFSFFLFSLHFFRISEDFFIRVFLVLLLFCILFFLGLQCKNKSTEPKNRLVLKLPRFFPHPIGERKRGKCQK